ncbi:MAG: TIM barrel protein [Clostridia bacterium]|nr:TIM barrel protein [Clostridia bacterium]
MLKAKFGPAGNSESFYAEGHKSTMEAFGWLREMGIDAYEYQAGNGLRTSEATLKALGKKAAEHGILMSLHTPYFISLSGIEEEKRLKSLSYVKESVKAAELLGADRIVIHSGSAAKISRDEAMALAKDTLMRIAEDNKDTKVKLGLETMGKINQLGTLDEVIELCKTAPCFVPVVDFGHLNAREQGGLFPDTDAYMNVFHKIGEQLGDEIARNLHCHFSKIEYTTAGEKKHLTFADTEFGPHFEPLAEAIIKYGLAPRIICESAGTQAEDALFMKLKCLEYLSK